MEKTLTNQQPYGLFVPIMNPTTPQDMFRMADRLEETAKALRQSANLILTVLGGGNQPAQEPLKADPTVTAAIGAQLAGSEAAQKFYGQNPPVFVHRAPKVMEAAIEVLKEAGRPVYITDIYEAVRKRGARVQDQANMSSMLSKNKGKDVRVLPGRHGFWELVPKDEVRLEFAEERKDPEGV